MADLEEINGVDVADFLHGYLTTALWSSHDERSENGGETIDANFSTDDIGPDSLAKADADCREFLDRCGQLIREESYIGRGRTGTLAAYAGHDFWLTRNGHGAGFWDGDWTEEYGERMSEVSRKMGSVDVYIDGTFDEEFDCWSDGSTVEFQ